MTTPDSSDGVWMWVPIIRDPNITTQLTALTDRLDQLMALVKIEQGDLDALDSALDAATQSLADKIAALDLPAGDLTALQEDLATLQNLSAPTPVEEPPA